MLDEDLTLKMKEIEGWDRLKNIISGMSRCQADILDNHSKLTGYFECQLPEVWGTFLDNANKIGLYDDAMKYFRTNVASIVTGMPRISTEESLVFTKRQRLLLLLSGFIANTDSNPLTFEYALQHDDDGSLDNESAEWWQRWIDSRYAEIRYLKTMPYAEYLKTDHWKQKRGEALAHAGWCCQVCNINDEDVTLHVHHKTYERRGQEELFDLTVLCAECHSMFHKHGKIHKNTWGVNK